MECDENKNQRVRIKLDLDYDRYRFDVHFKQQFIEQLTSKVFGGNNTQYICILDMRKGSVILTLSVCLAGLIYAGMISLTVLSSMDRPDPVPNAIGNVFNWPSNGNDEIMAINHEYEKNDKVLVYKQYMAIVIELRDSAVNGKSVVVRYINEKPHFWSSREREFLCNDRNLEPYGQIYSVSGVKYEAHICGRCSNSYIIAQPPVRLASVAI